MNEIRENPEGQDNEAGQGATNVHEDNGKPPLPPNAGNIGKERSFVWGHFPVIEGGKNLRQLVTTVAQRMLVVLS